MTHYSQRSRDRLATANPDLRKLFHQVDVHWPHTILEGARSTEQQEENVRRGVSKTMDSRHLDRPDANAVDAAPDPLRWPKLRETAKRISQSRLSPEELADAIQQYAKSLARHYYFGGYVLGTADQMYRHGELDQPVRHGADWDQDRRIDDQRFDDLPHFESGL